MMPVTIKVRQFVDGILWSIKNPTRQPGAADHEEAFCDEIIVLGRGMIVQMTRLRHWWAILAAGVAVLGQSCFSDIVEGQDSADRRAFRIVGYLPDYRLSAFDTTAARFVTDLVVFSA